jgi:hypothetical protein
MANLVGTTVAANFEKVTNGTGLGPRTQIINFAKTNITKAEMAVAVKELALVYTVAGVAGFLQDESADNVKIAIQGTITYAPDSTDALGVTGAATTVIADFDQTK